MNNFTSILGIPAAEYDSIAQTIAEHSANDGATIFGRIILLLVSIGALILNSLIIYITWRNPAMRSSSNFIIASVSITDSVTSFVQIPSVIGQLVTGGIVGGVDACVTIGFFLVVLSGVSQWGVAMLAFDRYISVVRNVNLTGFHVFLMSLGLWIIDLLIGSIPLIAGRQRYFGLKMSAMYCAGRYYDYSFVGLGFSLFCLSYIMSTQVFMSFCYSNVVKKYVSARTGAAANTIAMKDIIQLLKGAGTKTGNTQDEKRHLATNGSVASKRSLPLALSVQVKEPRALTTNDANATLFHEAPNVKELDHSPADANATLHANLNPNKETTKQRDNAHFKQELLLLKKSIIIIGVFTMCWTPTLLCILYELASGHEAPKWADSLCVIVATSSAGVNAAMNFILDSRYRSALKQILFNS